MTRLVVNTDGGARGNPGPAAIGVVVSEPGGAIVAEVGEKIGVATNNVAEYRALLRGLEEASRLGADEVEFRLDSQLVVEQMKGRYRVKDANLAKLHAMATELVRGFRRVEYGYVPRASNAEADALVNAALDGKPLGGGAGPAAATTPPGTEWVAHEPAWAEAVTLALPTPAFTSQSTFEPVAGATGVSARVILEASGLRGMELRFEPGAELERGRLPRAQHLVCLQGRGLVRVGAGEQPFADGQFVVVPGGLAHGARAGAEGLQLVALEVG